MGIFHSKIGDIINLLNKKDIAGASGLIIAHIYEEHRGESDLIMLTGLIGEYKTRLKSASTHLSIPLSKGKQPNQEGIKNANYELKQIQIVVKKIEKLISDVNKRVHNMR